MAIKATIYKAQLNLSDLDRNVYADHSVTLARHPSETDERMMVRLLAFALNAPADPDQPPLEFAKDMWEPDEPSLWQKDPTGRILHWIDVGQPDEKRLLRTTARVDRMSVFTYSSSTEQWWKMLEPGLSRMRNLNVWQVPSAHSQALAAMAERTMRLQITIQDQGIWVENGTQTVEMAIKSLRAAAD